MAVILAILVGCLSTQTEGKLVDLTHYNNDNQTVLWPGYDNFELHITYRGWLELEDGSRLW